MRHGIARIRGNEQSSMDACPAAADTQHAGAPHWVRLGASAHREPKLAKAACPVLCQCLLPVPLPQSNLRVAHHTTHSHAHTATPTHHRTPACAHRSPRRSLRTAVCAQQLEWVGLSASGLHPNRSWPRSRPLTSGEDAWAECGPPPGCDSLAHRMTSSHSTRPYGTAFGISRSRRGAQSRCLRISVAQG